MREEEVETTLPSDTHVLERTSPKGPGQNFIGTCIVCGATGLVPADALKPCPGRRTAALAAALPHLGEPVVKPLEWYGSDVWGWWGSDSPFPGLRYFVVSDRVDEHLPIRLASDWLPAPERWFADFAAAKAFAQADYEQRIRSALYAAPHPAPATLGEIAAEAKARFDALTPEQQEAEMRAQRESWVRGEAAMGSDADEAREREALRGLNQVPAGQKLTLGEMAGILRASGFVVLDQAAEARLAAADPVSDPRVRAVVEAVRELIPLLPTSDSSVPTRSAQDWDYRQAKARLRHAIDALPNQSEAK